MKYPIKAIIFDADGVIFDTYDAQGKFLWTRNIKREYGLTSAHFSLIFSQGWIDVMEGKIDFLEHLQKVFQEDIFQHIAMTPQEYVGYWLERDHQIREEMLALVKNLTIPCAMGTNQEGLRTRRILETIGSYFQKCFASYQVGFIKPNPGFFRHIEKTLQISPQNLLMIDDKKENVRGAQYCGWQGYHYQGDTLALSRFLADYLPAEYTV